MAEPAIDVAHGLVAAHLARTEDLDEKTPFLGLTLERFADWMQAVEPEQLPAELVTLVAALSGTVAWFARYATADVPEDYDLTEFLNRSAAAEVVDDEFQRLCSGGLRSPRLSSSPRLLPPPGPTRLAPLLR